MLEHVRFLSRGRTRPCMGSMEHLVGGMVSKLLHDLRIHLLHVVQKEAPPIFLHDGQKQRPAVQARAKLLKSRRRAPPR